VVTGKKDKEGKRKQRGKKENETGAGGAREKVADSGRRQI
jgi:hypothetical protein